MEANAGLGTNQAGNTARFCNGFEAASSRRPWRRNKRHVPRICSRRSAVLLLRMTKCPCLFAGRAKRLRRKITVSQRHFDPEGSRYAIVEHHYPPQCGFPRNILRWHVPEPPHPRPLSPRGARGELILLPSPLWGRGWTAAGVLTSRGGPGEGVPYCQF
jgi:hypothetical protein